MTLDKTLRMTVSAVALIGAAIFSLPAGANSNFVSAISPGLLPTGPLQLPNKVPPGTGNAVTAAPNIDAARLTGSAQTEEQRRRAQSRNLPASGAGGVNARLGTESLGNGKTAVVDLEGDRLVQVAIAPNAGGDAAMKALAEAAEAAGDGGQATRITQEMAKRVIDKAVNLSGVTPASGVKQLANGEIVLTGEGTAPDTNGMSPEEAAKAMEDFAKAHGAWQRQSANLNGDLANAQDRLAQAQRGLGKHQANSPQAQQDDADAARSQAEAERRRLEEAADGAAPQADGEGAPSGNGAGAAGQALDPEERDKALAARRSLSDYARLAKTTGADRRQLERIGEAGEVAREVQLLEQARAAADLDAIKETAPESTDPIAGHGAGHDMPRLNPGEPRVQPGGPNDPATRDGLPNLFGYDPQNPGATRRDEGPRNPSNTIPDRRGPASQQGWTSGGRVVRYDNGGWNRQRRWADSDGHHTVTEDYKPDGNGGWTQTYDHITDEGSWTTHRSSQKHIDADGNVTVHNDPIEHERNTPVEVTPDGEDDGDEGDPAGQPAPHDGETGDFDISLCVQAKLCGHQSGHSASPDEMLTQPGGDGQDTGSIMGSGASGPDLGREAVTNTGDGSFDTTRSGGGGGGSGGVDYKNPGDPVEPIE